MSGTIRPEPRRFARAALTARLAGVVLAGAMLAAVLPAAPSEAQPAKEMFGAVAAPAAVAPRPIGSYAKGCLAGAQALPPTGPHWQAMRLSRNRNWGHPRLVAFLERLAVTAAREDGWPGLLVGDMSQPRGGPMLTGHASHQIGLDGDIWLTPMPNRILSAAEREQISAVSMLREGTLQVDPRRWTQTHARLIRRAAMDPEVARIFVHPGIKQALCETAGRDRGWLRTVRPWYGHHYHFHVRLACPPGTAGCVNQAPPPPGDGCGQALAWWLSPEPWKPAPKSDKPAKKPRPMMLGDLPAACGNVLAAGGGPPPGAAAGAPLPRSRPSSN